MTGAVIGAVILGILTSGFTFLNVDAHYQEIVKGSVIVAAVVAHQYRQRRRNGAHGLALGGSHPRESDAKAGVKAGLRLRVLR